MRFLVVIACFLAAPLARAATRLCLEVHAEEDQAGFERLVRNELQHHPSHVVVSDGCDSRLSVELFKAAQVRYLTARINQEVPVRYELRSPRDLDDRLSEALRQVLQHDPVYLSRDLSRLNVVWRTVNNIVKRGLNTYRIELFQLVGTSGHNPIFAGGAAFSVSRGIEHVSVFSRLVGCGAPQGFPDGEVLLRLLAGAEVGFAYEFSPRRNASFYLSPGVGLHFMRFEGRLQAGQDYTPANLFLVSALARLGVRFLRFYSFDFDLFVQGHLPLYLTRDPDSELVDSYTPYMQLGMGVGF